jgi:hypothetical protein
MKLFPDVRRGNSIYTLLVIALLLASCATNHSQFGTRLPATIKDNFDNPKTISHTFYLVGDAGNSDLENPNNCSRYSDISLAKADSSSTLIFLGDNIYPKGMPKKVIPIEKPPRKSSRTNSNSPKVQRENHFHPGQPRLV